MYFEITVTVHTHRDPESDPYSYTETSIVRMSDISAHRTKALIKSAHANFKATLPFNINPGTMLPTDVHVREVRN